MNCREAQEESKSFHYACLLLSILLVAWKFLEDNQFPLQAEDLPEATKFASLWTIKDLERIKESKIFWILMEMYLQVAITQRPRLFPTLLKQLTTFVEFTIFCIMFQSGCERNQSAYGTICLIWYLRWT